MAKRPLVIENSDMEKSVCWSITKDYKLWLRVGYWPVLSWVQFPPVIKLAQSCLCCWNRNNMCKAHTISHCLPRKITTHRKTRSSFCFYYGSFKRNMKAPTNDVSQSQRNAMPHHNHFSYYCVWVQLGRLTNESNIKPTQQIINYNKLYLW